MKINGNHHNDLHGAPLRQAAKARSGGAASGDAAAPVPATPAPTAVPTLTSPAPTSVGESAPIESTVTLAARKLPPGLVRVAARLEAAGVEGRTGGQSNAFAQITRNLQRYAETQGLVTSPAPSPAAPAVPSADVVPVTPEASTDTTPPAGTSPVVDSALIDTISDAAVEPVEQAPV